MLFLPVSKVFKAFFSFLIISLITGSAFAQQVIVTGMVTDSVNAPLSGVSVVLQGTKKGSTTDAKGRYTISVPANATLLFSSIGMEAQTIALAGRTQVNVQLSNASNSLTDVVVIGYGVVKKRNLIGSVASIGAKDLQDRPITRVDQALAGQMPGVQVQSVSGAPGAALQIRVEGFCINLQLQ